MICRVVHLGFRESSDLISEARGIEPISATSANFAMCFDTPVSVQKDLRISRCVQRKSNVKSLANKNLASKANI
jgi:hypothetical protein